MFYQSKLAARGALLTTVSVTAVSAAALVLAASNDAAAQNATPAWWASVEGQYNWVDGDALDFYGLDANPEKGFAGRLHLGARIGNGWSAALGLRYGKTDRESDSSYSSFFNGEYLVGEEADVDYEEEHLIVDLEIGRDIGLGNGGNARVFGGLRFARFDGDGSFGTRVGGEYYSRFDADTEHTFTGFGPRVGVDAAIPVANSVQVDVGVAGAVLYGKRKLKIKGDYSQFSGEVGGSYSDSESKNVFIPSVEASVALTYLLGQNARISAGYKAEQFWNIMPTIESNVGGSSNSDRLIHGPFLELTITGN